MTLSAEILQSASNVHFTILWCHGRLDVNGIKAIWLKRVEVKWRGQHDTFTMSILHLTDSIFWITTKTGHLELKSVGKWSSWSWTGHPLSKMNIVPTMLVITCLCLKAWFWGKKVSDLESFDGGRACSCKCVDKGSFAPLMLPHTSGCLCLTTKCVESGKCDFLASDPLACLSAMCAYR